MTAFSEAQNPTFRGKTALFPCLPAVLSLEIAKFQAALVFFSRLLMPRHQSQWRSIYKSRSTSRKQRSTLPPCPSAHLQGRPLATSIPLPAPSPSCPRRWQNPALATTLVALGFLLFASHGATVEGYALNDLMTFFGWINGLDQGRVPSVDFPAPVGVLAHILPWLGSRLSGQFAGAMEWAGVLAAAMLLTLSCIALHGRASAPVATLFLIAVFGLSCVPWNPGDGAGVVSHVGFYNRWGWATLAVLMLLGCSGQQQAGRQWLADAVVVALTLLFLFFLKMTYFLAAFGFVVGFGLLLRRFLKASFAGLAAFLGGVFGVQATTGYVLPHLQQLGGTVQATGLVWSDVVRLNLPLVLPLCAIAASACILTMRRKSVLQDVAMPLFGLAACVLLAVQNAPSACAFTLAPAFVQASALALDAKARWSGLSTRAMSALVLALMSAFLLPQFVVQAVAAGFHVNIVHFSGNGFSVSPYRSVDLPRVGSLHTMGRQNMDYARTLSSGVALLREAQPPCTTAAALDFAQPFAPLAGLPPSRSFFWIVHVGRTVSRATPPPPAQTVFADVDCVMQPKHPLDMKSTAFLLEAYGTHLEQAYRVQAESADWLFLRKRDQRAS